MGGIDAHYKRVVEGVVEKISSLIGLNELLAYLNRMPWANHFSIISKIKPIYFFCNQTNQHIGDQDQCCQKKHHAPPVGDEKILKTSYGCRDRMGSRHLGGIEILTIEAP